LCNKYIGCRLDNLKKLQSLSKHFTVLYVEDNPSLRDNAQKLLKKFFKRVTVAEDGQEGLEKFKQFRYPIVITDIKMPRLDGVSLIKKIKLISPQTKIVVLSAFDDKEYLLEFIEEGVFKFLKKPVSLQRLTDVLYDVVVKLREENHSINSLSETQDSNKSGEENSTDESEKNFNDTKLLFELLEKMKNENKKLELHNYYKGLSITNDASIIHIDHEKESIIIHTSFIQQKAIQHEEVTYIVSESLPYVVFGGEIELLSFDKGEMKLQKLSFTKSSPVDRETVRVYPEKGYEISLFAGDEKLQSDITIQDISLNGVRITMSTLPAGLRINEKLHVEINLGKSDFYVNVGVSIYRIDESETMFQIVLLFETPQRKQLTKYITKRQMAIIREFKGIQNGQ